MCQTATNPYNGELHAASYSLSKKITDAVCAATGFKNRGVQETDSMSGINWCKIPVYCRDGLYEQPGRRPEDGTG